MLVEQDFFIFLYEKVINTDQCVCLQPIGALLLEQCRVEREDDLTFSISE